MFDHYFEEVLCPYCHGKVEPCYESESREPFKVNVVPGKGEGKNKPQVQCPHCDKSFPTFLKKSQIPVPSTLPKRKNAGKIFNFHPEQ